VVKPQAKDIGDADMLDLVDQRSRITTDYHLPRRGETRWVSRWEAGETRWVSSWEIEDCMPSFPPKVVLAKLRALIRKGLLDGCGCGCRGDFRLTDKGAAMLIRTRNGAPT